MSTFTAYEGLAVGQRAGNGYVHGATTKQERYIDSLLAQRVHDLPYTRGSEVNIRHASRVIDHLLACPTKERSAERADAASPKQIAFLKSLLADRDDPSMADAVEKMGGPDALCKKDASRAIDTLMRAPRKTVAPAAELPAAIYLLDGDVIKVQKAVHGSGHMYAKKLNPETGKFEYTQGLIRRLDISMRMTLEQAKEFGALYGVCCNCGRTLTNEDSIEAGIGPICAGKFL
jgi:hypothetical protein